MKKNNLPTAKNILLIANKKDTAYHDELKSHLSIIHSPTSRFTISISSILEIAPGSNRNKKIDELIDAADIVVLMISADLINEKSKNKRELIRIVNSDKERIAIITRNCFWQSLPCLTNEHFVILPRDEIAISSYERKDEVYEKITRRIYSIIDESIKTKEDHLPGEIVTNQNLITTSNLGRINEIVDLIANNDRCRIVKISGPQRYGRGTISTLVKKKLIRKRIKAITINFKQIRSNLNKDINYLYQEFCRHITQRLGLEDKINDYWSEHKGRIPELVCEAYIKKYIFSKYKEPFVIVIHHLNQIVGFPEILEQIIHLINIFNDKGAMDANWKSMKFIVTYHTEDEFLYNKHSPSLKGVEVKLSDFSMDDIFELTKKYNIDLTAEEINNLIAYLNGVPFLIDRSLYEIKTRNIKCDDFISELKSENNSFINYLNLLWNRINKDPKNVKVLKDILKEKNLKGSAETIFLWKIGVIEFKGGNYIFKNKLYKQFFSEMIK